MKRLQVIFIMMFALFTFAGVAHAQLDKKETSTLKKATGKLDNAEKTMAAGKEMFDEVLSTGSLNDFTIERSEKKTNEAETRAKDAEEILGTLNASAPEVKEAQARIAKIYADATVERKRYQEARDKVKKANDLWGAVDRDAAEALQKKLGAYSSELSASFPDKSVLDTWAQLSKEVEATLAQYKDAYAPSGKGATNASTFGQLAIKDLKKEYDETIRIRESKAQSIPTQVEESLARAKKFAQEAIDKGTFGQFIHVVGPEISQIEGYLTAYAALSSDQKFIEKTRASLEELNSLQKKHEAKIIENNKTPEDVYQGADKSKLISLITDEVGKANKGQKVLGVKITESDWRRIAGEKWNANNLSWEKYDESQIYAVAIVSSADGKYGYIYHMTIVKKHMANDKLILSYFSISGKPTMPSDIVLISNAK
jgi:hypothetical protein